MSTQDHSVSTAALNKSSSSDDRISSFIRDSQPATGIYEENPNGEAVQACFTRIIELCHEQLHPTLRSLIQGRWGLSEDIIDEAKLGYLPESYDLVDALQKDGFSLLTMYRTGVITDGILSHLYSCKPNECRHPFTGPIHELACQRHRGELEPEAIDLAAVIEYAVENDCHLPRTPWTNRIIFPYRGDDGHFHYLVARRTGRSRRDPKYMKLIQRFE